MARLTLDDALRALAVTLLFAAACESRAPIGPNRQPIQSGPCEDCHAAPPPTGAHLAHTSPGALDGLAYGDLRILEDAATGGTRYVFGRGHCHPIPVRTRRTSARTACRTSWSTPPAQAVPGDAIKLRNTPQAAWIPATGTCSGVYCHSSGTVRRTARLPDDAGLDRDARSARLRRVRWQPAALRVLGPGPVRRPWPNQRRAELAHPVCGGRLGVGSLRGDARSISLFPPRQPELGLRGGADHVPDLPLRDGRPLPHEAGWLLLPGH